jgi:hypothetical protein
MKLQRPKLLIPLLLSTVFFSNPVAAREWPFKVYLDGKEIGQHSFVVNEKDGVRELLSSAKFNVKILFINAYSYDHIAKESWQGDCLTSLQAHTQENKEVTNVEGKLGDQAFLLDSPKGKQTLPACVMTFAYWNPKMLTQSKLLNPQTGEWLDIKIRSLGNEKIDVRGQQVQAEHFKLDATKLKIDLWYSPDKEWLALKSTTPEGYEISYKLR